MKKILFVASTLSHIENFHTPYLNEFNKQGYVVHVMGKPNNKAEILYADKILPIAFEKNMFSVKNIVIAFKISKIIKAENYDIISIHTSLAAFFTRLGIMLCFKKPKLVVNTVHGYLFDDKTSFLKRSIMLLAEKFTKCITDIIIVMNSIDYDIAKKHKLYKDSLYLINGMGIDTSLFPSISYENKIDIRKKFNFSEDDFILVYVAEFSKRKNQKFLLDSINKLVNDDLKNIKLLLLGDGQFLNELKIYSNTLGISENVIFTGYTRNTKDYYHIADVCVSSSRSEGLPFNIMEAMSIGLPIVASKVKGHTNLIVPKENGFLFEYDNTDEFCNYIKTIYNDKNLQHNMGTKSKQLCKNYSLEAVLPNIINIICNEYKSHL
ncbi:glycosyltransferase [Clostridium chromiireducens]|uniref:Putative glycosyltransferase EpsD n=1 Tax=Clostridium chromiireducens TaxID=225345 RepID=A0A1V4IIM3_9CLOT|nr:glycosyltransferase [Clostridium chromiireducens]OPJ59545.1 putative glycosyltransferase EpsD [Clostridium chromiireducens]